MCFFCYKFVLCSQLKLQEAEVARSDVETQSRAGTAQLLAAVVEKDKLIKQISTALQSSDDRVQSLNEELRQARADAVDLAKFYDQKVSQAEALQKMVQQRAGTDPIDTTTSADAVPQSVTLQKLLSLKARIEGFLNVEETLRSRLSALEQSHNISPQSRQEERLTPLSSPTNELSDTVQALQEELQQTKQSRDKISNALLSVLQVAGIDREAILGPDGPELFS